jgi:anti-sigma B factor antagonist
MSFEILWREVEKISVFELRGRMTAGAPVEEFREHLAPFLIGPEPRVILDMKRVDFIDSTGLGHLVAVQTAAKRTGGSIKLLNLTTRNLELLVITKLTTVFEIFDDEQSAVDSFFADRVVKKFDVLDFVREQQRRKRQPTKLS